MAYPVSYRNVALANPINHRSFDQWLTMISHEINRLEFINRDGYRFFEEPRNYISLMRKQTLVAEKILEKLRTPISEENQEIQELKNRIAYLKIVWPSKWNRFKNGLPDLKKYGCVAYEPGDLYRQGDGPIPRIVIVRAR